MSRLNRPMQMLSQENKELRNKIARLEEAKEDVEDRYDRLLLRVRAILMWAPQDDANRKWIEDLISR